MHYIEDLLPRLGERDVQQTTFADWALTRMQIKGRYKIVDSPQGVFLASYSDRELLKKLWQRARLKGSLKIKKLLQKYLDYLKHRQVIPEEGLAYYQIGELKLDFTFSASEIRGAIEVALATESVSLEQARVNAFLSLRHLIQKKYEENVFAKEKELFKQAELLERALESVENHEEKGLLTQEINSYRTFRTRAFSTPILRQKATSLVSVLLQKDFDQIWKPVYFVDDFFALFKNQKLLSELCKGVFPVSDTWLLFNDDAGIDSIEMEDLAALYYFQELVNGKLEGKYDHIVVDEVQDFSPLQLELIYSVSKDNSMTLVGDIAQSIHAYRGMSKWGELEDIIPRDKISFEEISQSYRSTQELVNFANDVLKQIQDSPLLAEPFARRGKQPVIVRVSNPGQLERELLVRVRALQQQYMNIAVIVKTTEQAMALIQLLEGAGTKPEISIHQLETEFKYSGGLVVLPIALTKGMEFEAVILYDASETEFSSQKPYDGRLLYVAVSRALHEMQILHTEELSGFLKDAKRKAKYELASY